MRVWRSSLKILFIYAVLAFCSLDLLGSVGLTNQRIRKLDGRKKSIYVSEGVFHNGSPKVKSDRLKVRHSYSEKIGYERVVFDFSTEKLPRVYAHYDSKTKKVSLDLFNTSLTKEIGSFGISKLVEKINFFPLSTEITTVEMILKDSKTIELFYLTNPARLVIDLKI